MRSPIGAFLERQGVVVLDGGLASELEARGAELGGTLWSARLLPEDPELIGRVHLEYLEAGADCITAASYQASFEGFGRHGLGETESADLLRLSVRLALDARERFWSHPSARTGRLLPLVAASVGPYGAFLADGSEYTGSYGLDTSALYDFHRRRFGLLAASGADLLACETVPSRAEARALARLIAETPGVHAWLSFSCRDGAHLSDGSLLREVVKEVETSPGLDAVGVNCVAPRWVDGLLAELRRATTKPLVVYPNAGEGWDAARKRWLPAGEPLDLGRKGPGWLRAGARLIGGCCRTRPADVRRLRRALALPGATS